MAKNKTNEVIQNGLKTFYHSNGEKESEGKYKDNKQEGKWTFWNQDGKQIAQGLFKDGLRSGQWKENDRQSSYTGKYKNDKKEGKWIEIWLGEKQQEKYYSAGEITREIYYHNKNQKRDDKDYINNHVTWWYANGQKQKEGGIKNKVAHAQWSHWYENGQLKSKGSYKNGTEDGQWTYWYDDGQKHSEGCYKDERRDGQWTYWHENGQKSAKGSFVSNSYSFGMIHGEGVDKKGRENGAVWKGKKEEQKDGKWTYWHSNGLKAAEGSYGNKGISQMGTLEKHISGDWPYGDSPGVEISTPVRFSHEKNGEWTYWHPNGNKSRQEKWGYVLSRKENESRGIYVADLIGRIYGWHSNGQMSLKGQFNENGRIDGKWVKWDLHGVRKFEGLYGYDGLFLFTEWSEDLEELRGKYTSGMRSGVWTQTARNKGSLRYSISYSDREQQTKEYREKLRGDFRSFYHGLHTYRNFDGSKDQEVNYKFGEKDGNATSWFEGKITQQAKYKKGELDGLVTKWSNGKKTHQANYKEGNLIDPISCWDSSGNKIPAIDSDGNTLKDLEFFWGNPDWIYWGEMQWRQIEDLRENELGADEFMCEKESDVSIIKKRKIQQSQQYDSYTISSSDEDGVSWLDRQALTDDEKLLGESFWRGIL